MRKRCATPATDPSSKKENPRCSIFSEGFTFRNFLTDAFAVFMFVLWFWLLIIVIGDLFRRHDISGWAKAIWVIALIVFPYLAIFAYMITQSRGMAERSSQQTQQAREELRRAVGFSVADEIEKLDRLKKSGSITAQEFARLRAKLVS
jgi:membrane protein implicated in regulation of membrane protease activity